MTDLDRPRLNGALTVHSGPYSGISSDACPLVVSELPHPIRKLGDPAALMTDLAYDNLKSAQIKIKIALHPGFGRSRHALQNPPPLQLHRPSGLPIPATRAGGRRRSHDAGRHSSWF